MDTKIIVLIAGLSVVLLISVLLALIIFCKRRNPSKPCFQSQAPHSEQVFPNRKQLKEKILNVIVTEKLYLDKNLTLGKLANKVQSNRHYVSQIINQEFNMNFYQFVNSYRIKEFESLLIKLGNIEKANIKYFAEQAGFKSFSSFNTFFKEIKGMTPGEYKRLLRQPSLFQDEKI